MIAPTGGSGGASAASSGIDFLSQMSGGAVTESEIATNGATEGNAVGNKVWTIGSLSATGGNNITNMVNAIGLGSGDINNHVAYGFVSLDAPQEQNTTMLVGSDDAVKVWLNGQLVHNNPVNRGANNFQDEFSVTLKEGTNILLVAIYEAGGSWSGFFGFAPDAEYTVLSPSTRFSLSTAATQIKIDDRFTVQLKAENISDLAGWQSDITFDPAVLKVNSVSEGSFLKQGGGRTHFLRGTIDNTNGRITDIGSARISEGGASGEGILLSVSFTAMANGESRLSLREFQAGSSLGETISSRPSDIIITVGDPPTLDISDGPFSLSTDITPVRFGDTFNLLLNAEDVTNLTDWYTDISFDPDVLEVVEVSEGDFLKSEGGTTFFLPGTIDNTAGEITRLNAALLSGGVTGTGTLLQITFTAKAVGETRLTFKNFQAGSGSGQVISSSNPEIVITVEARAYPAWDVNQDGRVNILDLILVQEHLGADASVDPKSDVNGDGTINILDLVVVAQHLGESTAAAAPADVAAMDSLELDPTIVQAWIAQAEAKNDGSIAFQRGIANLQRLLALLLPKETALLANYPNPFNPETWIPYHLAEPSEVTVHIYTAGGVLVRTLGLGYQVAGIYERRSRAAYWEGRNQLGEPVASGVYFYTLTAGDFTATRKMLIIK